MKGDHENNFMLDLDPLVVAWMQEHTVGDLKRIAREIEEAGGDADGIWRFIDELLPLTEAILRGEHAIEKHSIEELDLENTILAAP